MDTLSHYLWTGVLYWRYKRAWLLALSGVLPDMMSFGALLVISLLNGTYQAGPPSLSALPLWLFTMYNISHSFLTPLVLFGILWYVKREWTIFTWGWFLHILMDIPTHTRAYFPTPFLWPLSTWTFSGFSWAQWWFMLLNMTLLVLVFIYLVFRKRFLSKKTKSSV